MANLSFDTERSVYGYFASEDAAEKAVRELRDAGFTREQISLAGRPDSDSLDDASLDRRSRIDEITGNTSNAYEQTDLRGKTHRAEHKAERAAGGFWDRVRNMFEGDSVEPYADERKRGEFATHEITDTYDYDPGDFHQSWAADDQTGRSKYFTQKFSQSGKGALVSVYAGDRRSEAEEILEANGADLARNFEDHSDTSGTSDEYDTATTDRTWDTSAAATSYGESARNTDAVNTTALNSDAVNTNAMNADGLNFGALNVNDSIAESGDRSFSDTKAEIITGSSDRSFNDTSEEAIAAGGSRGLDDTRATDTTGPRRIQLYGEVLRVHRDRIQRGEVRVRKEIVTEMQTVQVPVTREELVVERIPVEGERAADGAAMGQEAEIRIPLSEERVSFTREPVVREEVEIGKREVTDTETRQEPVRREELRVDEDADHLRKAS